MAKTMTKTVVFAGERFTQDQFDKLVFTVFRRVDDFGASVYEVSRDMYVRSTVRTFETVRLALVRLAENKTTWRGRRVVTTTGSDYFRLVKKGRR